MNAENARKKNRNFKNSKNRKVYGLNFEVVRLGFKIRSWCGWVRQLS